ncbi:MAG: hypothetical protein GY849_04775 [Deltaproteobacteria bacterium]|nr:hypothetical protein [Deltaproteobacteria bacterium]
MSKIVIGIHGLGNKPSRKVLHDWWRKAILEGLKAIGHPRPLLKFELVYWANFLYEKPLDPNEKDEDHPLFVEDPYTPANRAGKERPRKLSEKILGYLKKQLDKVYLNKDLSINYTVISDLIIRHYFRDLDIYYSKTCFDKTKSECRAKDVIREELAQALKKHRKRDVLLIAHSMGSVIAYDVLSMSPPDIKAYTWVTIGSPLGLPAVMIKILTEQDIDYKKELKVRTPDSVVESWYNFSDLEDKVALDIKLRDNYQENSNHVRPIDAIVTNDYEYKGHKNPHKAYGYLRTPQLAEVVRAFMDHGRPGVVVRLTDLVNRSLAWMLEKGKK